MPEWVQEFRYSIRGLLKRKGLARGRRGRGVLGLWADSAETPPRWSTTASRRRTEASVE